MRTLNRTSPEFAGPGVQPGKGTMPPPRGGVHPPRPGWGAPSKPSGGHR
jgi:hypothetical protein